MGKMTTLTVWLVGRAEPLQNALKQAANGVKKFKDYVTSGLGSLGVGLGFAALIAGAKQLVDSMDNIGKAAGNLGITAESYQKLSYAARRTNTPVEMVEMAMRKTRLMAGNLAIGNIDAANTFGTLGLRIQDLQGLSTDEMFDRIATAINYVNDPLERSALLAKMFGEEGEKLNNFLRDYNALGREAAARGLIIKDAEIKAAENLKDSVERLNTAFTRLAANTGFVTILAAAAKGLDVLLNYDDYVKEANYGGFYTRESGVDYALQKAKESGRYTPEQLELMEKGSANYKKMYGQSIFHGGSYVLIDQALREAGLAELVRNTNLKPWDKDQWQNTQQTARRRATLEESNKAEEERRKQEKERAEKVAQTAVEAAARAAQDLKDKNNKTLEKLVQSAERDVRIDTLKQSGNTVEAELQRRLGGLYGNKDLDPHLFDRLQKALETQITAEEKAAKAAKDRQEKENQERYERTLEDSFNNTVRDLNQRAEIDRLRREGKTLDADLLERVYSFRNQGKILTDNQVEAMRKALEKVQTPATVAVAEQRSAITAALQGSLEAYRARVNQGKNIPDQQLKVQQQQLSEQKKTNQLLENNKTGGATLEVAAIGGVK